MIKKYIFTSEIKEGVYGNKIILHRIKAVQDFGNVKAGDIGGWIEKEENLSHAGNCWVGKDAIVYDNAQIEDNAEIISGTIFGNAKINGNALIVGEKTVVCDTAEVCDYAKIVNGCVSDNARVGDHAELYDGAAAEGLAKIGGMTTLRGAVVVSDYARLNGSNVTILGPAKITGNAKITGEDYTLRGLCHIGEGALISASEDMLAISVDNRNYTFYKTSENGIRFVIEPDRIEDSLDNFEKTAAYLPKGVINSIKELVSVALK